MRTESDMKSKEIIELIKKEMRDGIDAVLAGKKKEFTTKTPIPADYAETYLKSLGWKKLNFDTNGWAYDWWLTVEKPNSHSKEPRYQCFGEGYYGGFEFRQDED